MAYQWNILSLRKRKIQLAWHGWKNKKIKVEAFGNTETLLTAKRLCDKAAGDRPVLTTWLLESHKLKLQISHWYPALHVWGKARPEQYKEIPISDFKCIIHSWTLSCKNNFNTWWEQLRISVSADQIMRESWIGEIDMPQCFITVGGNENIFMTERIKLGQTRQL